ncbi:SixA phosphatase family protein [Sagittula stellata]|uniref:Phosphoglycerate mutase family protein n=1 Tax=Sagittula stellata (strain ATCC 700073 / DSM 11524 / E-37) TaxID=388399 RepID=A3JXJ1_SAGS3|nr:histidine phosphatase family protein [Sagittula stellata]EBA10227.1 phosphoglycerate mutase family protein [Sagittula stellata E-37]
MKRLILMRHAKSDWALGQPDAARPLNARGQRSAAAMGDWLREKSYLPDEILCSTAQRTRETLDLLRITAPTSFQKGLYLAAPEKLRKALRKAKGEAVLMLGHNPGIGLFAQSLEVTPPDHPRFDDYPTCATLIVDFPITDWTKLDAPGEAVDFAVGRDFSD